MGSSSEKKIKPNSSIERRYERLAFGLLVFFVFLVPTKFGLINLDTAPTQFPPIPSFLSLMEQFPEEIGQVILILIFLLWFMKSSLSNKINIRYSLPSVFLSAFILAGIISTLRSVVIHSSVIYLKSFISYFLFFHLVINLASNERRQKILLCSFIGGSALVGLIGLYQYFIGLDRMIQDVYRNIPQEQWGDYIARIERGRVFSTFTYPNSLAGFLLISIPLSILFPFLYRKWFYQNNMWKGIVYVLLVILPSLFSFIVTESKGGYIAFAIIVLVALIFTMPYISKIYRIVIIIALVGLISISIVLSFTLSGRNLIAKGAYTFEERVEYWRAAVKMIPLRPVFGSGFFSFAPMYNKFRSVEANDTQTVHNNYLQILVETGFTGFILFLSFWITICLFGLGFLISNIKSQNFSEYKNIITIASLLGIFGFLLHNIVDFDLYIPGITFSAMFLAAIIILNSASLKTWNISFKKEYVISIVLISLTVIFLFAVFLTVKTIWGAERFYTGYKNWEEAEDNLQINFPYAKEMFEQAENDFKDALWWDGLNHNFYSYLGDLKLRLGEIYNSKSHVQDALDYYIKAISLNRYNPVYKAKRVMATKVMGEINGRDLSIKNADILNLWKEVIEYAPTASYYRIFYADELRLSGDTSEAIKEYQIALKLDPEFKNALRKSLGRYNEIKFKSAIQNLEKLIKE